MVVYFKFEGIIGKYSTEMKLVYYRGLIANYDFCSESVKRAIDEAVAKEKADQKLREKSWLPR